MERVGMKKIEKIKERKVLFIQKIGVYCKRRLDRGV